MTMLRQFIETMLSTEWQTLAVIGVLCGIACLFLKEYLATPLFIIFVYPILVFLSVLTHHGFILLELYPSNKLDQWLMWTILAAITGTISGTALVACISTFRDRKVTFRVRA